MGDCLGVHIDLGQRRNEVDVDLNLRAREDIIKAHDGVDLVEIIAVSAVAGVEGCRVTTVDFNPVFHQLIGLCAWEFGPFQFKGRGGLFPRLGQKLRGARAVVAGEFVNDAVGVRAGEPVHDFDVVLNGLVVPQLPRMNAVFFIRDGNVSASECAGGGGHGDAFLERNGVEGVVVAVRVARHTDNVGPVEVHRYAGGPAVQACLFTICVEVPSHGGLGVVTRGGRGVDPIGFDREVGFGIDPSERFLAFFVVVVGHPNQVGGAVSSKGVRDGFRTDGGEGFVLVILGVVKQRVVPVHARRPAVRSGLLVAKHKDQNAGGGRAGTVGVERHQVELVRPRFSSVVFKGCLIASVEQVLIGHLSHIEFVVVRVGSTFPLQRDRPDGDRRGRGDERGVFGEVELDR